MTPASSGRGGPSARPSPSPCLITGAAGFIGSRLALALRSGGSAVRALVRPGHDVCALERAGAEIVRGDATDRDAMSAAASGCGVIYHLAAARGKHKLGYRAFQTENRRIAEVVGEAALEAGVQRVVVASTATLTGYGGPDGQTEETPPRPNSAYRASRLHSEQVFERLRNEHDLDVVIARVPQRVMGPGARAWARPVRAVRDGAVRFLPAGGTIHSGDVDDIVDGLRRCARTPGIGGECFLLGASAPIGLRTVLQTIADHLGVGFAPRVVPSAPFRAYVAFGNLVFRYTRRSLPHHFTAEFYSARIALDIGKARRELGFSPRFESSESVGRTVAWLRDQGLV